MDELYLIMNECLKNQYSVKAIISVLETLESSYSEEEEIALKSMAYVIKTYLEVLQKDMDTTISQIDHYIVVETQNKKS